MTVLNQTIEVVRPVQGMVAYVSDSGTTGERDASATRSAKLTPGPVGVGARFFVRSAPSKRALTVVTEAWSAGA
jgi:hypothetical protein